MQFPDQCSDVHTLVTFLHRATLLRLAKASGGHIQGCSFGAKQCAMTPHWRRRCRELDTVAGWARKISPEKVQNFLTELDAELAGQRACTETSEDAANHNFLASGRYVDIGTQTQDGSVHSSGLEQECQTDLKLHHFAQAAKQSSISDDEVADYETEFFPHLVVHISPDEQATDPDKHQGGHIADEVKLFDCRADSSSEVNTFEVSHTDCDTEGALDCYDDGSAGKSTEKASDWGIDSWASDEEAKDTSAPTDSCSLMLDVPDVGLRSLHCIFAKPIPMARLPTVTSYCPLCGIGIKQQRRLYRDRPHLCVDCSSKSV
ncbi:unnamed protein product [Prorocentrum cordatum]|uniref:Uncharacterized protein n=1 Tax=Prorocentrum cordatum TaxID=2364126 RepID=A0ABN9V8D4_9DINO|nr:unnamed protein product [Polarella glacialis]